MKSSTDPRHQKRRDAVKLLFAEDFTHQKASSEIVKEIIEDKNHIDETIQRSAPTWPIDKLNKIDLAVLRLAIYEMEKGVVPPKVVIDEAVELAKEYGGESSPSFVNGVLGSVFKELGLEEKKTEENIDG
jgi:N utilization substance protein B